LPERLALPCPVQVVVRAFFDSLFRGIPEKKRLAQPGWRACKENIGICLRRELWRRRRRALLLRDY
jgi:hypothetical protein